MASEQHPPQTTPRELGLDEVAQREWENRRESQRVAWEEIEKLAEKNARLREEVRAALQTLPEDFEIEMQDLPPGLQAEMMALSSGKFAFTEKKKAAMPGAKKRKRMMV